MNQVQFTLSDHEAVRVLQALAVHLQMDPAVLAQSLQARALLGGPIQGVPLDGQEIALEVEERALLALDREIKTLRTLAALGFQGKQIEELIWPDQAKREAS